MLDSENKIFLTHPDNKTSDKIIFKENLGYKREYSECITLTKMFNYFRPHRVVGAQLAHLYVRRSRPPGPSALVVRMPAIPTFSFPY